MKNILIFINAILIAAVGYLFYEVKTLKSGGNSTPAISNVKPLNTGQSTIAYVNTDSLLDNYEYYNDLKKQIEKKQSNAENIIQSRANFFSSYRISTGNVRVVFFLQSFPFFN